MWKKHPLLQLAGWPFLEYLTMFLVESVDFWMAGHLPDGGLTALDAMGTSLQLGIWIYLLPMTLAWGTVSWISRARGAGQGRRCRHLFAQGCLLGLLAGGLGALLMLLLAEPAARYLCGLRGKALTQTLTCIHASAVWMPLGSLLLVANMSLRAAGDTRTPLILMLSVTGLNIAFSWWLAITHNWGLVGIVFGTGLAWLAAIGLLILLLHRKRARIHWDWRAWRLRRSLSESIWKVGWPHLFEQIGLTGTSMGLIALIGQITRTQPGALGSHFLIIRIESFAGLIPFALMVPASTLTGHYLGRRNPAEATRACMACLRWGFALTLPVALVFMLLPDLWIRLFSKEAAHLQLVRLPLQIAVIAQLLGLPALLLCSALRTAGDTFFVARCSVLCRLVLRLGGGWLLALHLGWGLSGIWLAIALDLGAQSLWAFWRFKQLRWQTLLLHAKVSS